MSVAHGVVKMELEVLIDEKGRVQARSVGSNYQECEGRVRTVVTDADLIRSEALEMARGLIEIAEMAMPDGYLETDSRVARARAFLAKHGGGDD